ncbi:2-dehydropantoate 2-reductase [Bacillus sp. B-jedd]|uniref:2-dehydropantoate 2-reductase n=1 Tax=Bacillus sp. B-jedd TaxID=1476857 RepID=UPI0005156BFE|nr:2-dehydropantoate 2-reductase [Bacillus sp. B-jedd]CEG26720.1 2-dehydropantoate 2-reductase [Bacillus sp. B-jedd]
MKIGIIGAGSIGLLFAAYLQRNFNVTLYTRNEEQADHINVQGVSLLKGVGPFTAKVDAVPLSNGIGEDDIIVIAVKQYQLEPILSRLPAGGNYLFLQNGMGHLKYLQELDARNIYVGSVEHGAYREDDRTVSHNGKGVTRAAVYKGDPSLLMEFAGLVPKEFPVHIEEDYYGMLANKLAANAVINPLTAILRVKNGELVSNHHFEKALECLFNEVMGILDLPDKTEKLLMVKGICRNTAENRSSMLKDLEAGRPTEVDAILGYLLEEAKGAETPLLTAYYELIKGMELAAERGRA